MHKYSYTHTAHSIY